MAMTDTATRLIKRFGQAATLIKQSAESDTDIDENTPWGDAAGGDGADPETFPVTVAVTGYSIEQRDTDLIGDADLRVFMAAGDAVPATLDTLTIGGIDYVIQRVGVLGPDGTTICYELQVRA